MDIMTLIQFVDVCDMKSISKAADKHFISRQSLTEAMNRLEREVGATLLTRTHAGVALTEEGHYFYLSMQRMVQQWMSTLEGLEEVTREKRAIRFATTLALMSDDTACELLSADILGIDRPLILYDCNTDECWNLLKKGKVDIAYTLNPRDEGELVSTPIISPLKSTYLMVSANSPLASKSSLTAADLKGVAVQEPWLETSNHVRVMEYLRRASANCLTVPNTHAIQKKLVLNQTANLLIPGSGIPAFADSRLVALPVVDFPRIMHQHLVWNRNATSEVVKAGAYLTKFLTEEWQKTHYIEDKGGRIRFPREGE